MPRVSGGRYGLSSKEFTPGMVAGVFEELARERPRRRFTVGINDDVSGTSLAYDPSLDIEPPDTVRAVFFGLGSDGTVGANKNTIKILGAEENLHAQGYFVYDSKKSGSQTVSHLRFGPQPIRAPYLVQQRELRRLPPVRAARPGRRARPGGARRDAAAQLPAPAGRGLGCAVAARPGADPRQGHRRLRDRRRPDRPRGRASPGGSTSCCRPASSRSPACCRATRRSPRSRRRSRRPTAGAAPRWSRATRRRSTRRWRGCTGSRCPTGVTTTRELPPPVPADAPEFVRAVTAEMMAGRGDELPVSALPVDGTYPSGTTAYEKRNISELVAVWDADLCIQCGNCSFVCPHSVIRSKYYDPSQPGGRAGRVPVGSAGGARAPRQPVTRCRSTSRTAPAAGCASRPARSWRRAIRSPRRSTSAQREPLVAAERENIAFFETLPVERPVPGRLRHGARHPVPGAAVRVLRRVRGLRRDARTSSCSRSCSATG